MKTLILALLLSSTAQAEEFTFNFKFEGQTYQAKVNGSSKLKASKEAASKCFQHFTKGEYPGEDKGLRIIDVCVNPDSTLQDEWYK